VSEGYRALIECATSLLADTPSPEPLPSVLLLTHSLGDRQKPGKKKNRVKMGAAPTCLMTD
jgi:hypothetical protein